MVSRTRRGPKKFLKYVTQFLDPKFNPERRTAMQMIAAAPVAGKMKLSQGALGQALDPVQFYRGLLTKGLDISDEWLNDPKLLREAILNELPDSGLHDWWKGHREGTSLGIPDIMNDARGQAFEDVTQQLTDYGPGELEQIADYGDSPAAKKLYAAHKQWWKATGSGVGEDAANEALDEAIGGWIDTLEPVDIVQEYGGDDLFSDYYDAVRGENIANYVDSEASRLGVSPEELSKRVGLEDFLKRAPQIGTATANDFESGYVDITDVPEYFYQDPEALRYAKLREMLEHPVLTPQQMLDATYGDVSRAVADIDAEGIANNLYEDMRHRAMGYKGDPLDLDLSRMPASTREALIRQFEKYKNADYMEPTRRRLAEQEPELMRVEDLPSYITNRTSPFRVKFNKADAGRKSVVEPLPYLDVIRALPPEEYSSGGYVDARS